MTDLIRNIISALIFLTLNCNVFGGVVVPSDQDYLVRKYKNYDLIFPEEFSKVADSASSDLNKIITLFSSSFNWQLDERASIVLGSSYNQIPNAFASVFPGAHTVNFPGGANIIEKFAVNSWLRTLLIHETAHLYQLNTKRSLSKISHFIFRNNDVTLFPLPFFISSFTTVPIPIITAPNVYLPTWILEGNAVFNESRFGNGGRLYSGEARALFYNMIKNGEVDAISLTNDHINFPYGESKYIIGGYLFAYLASVVGVNEANDFFYTHALRYWNPLRINKTFKDKFNISYDDFIQRAIYYYLAEAYLQEKSEGMIITKSKKLFPLSKKNKLIYFLTNKTGKKENTLNEYDFEVGDLNERDFNIPGGKLFLIDKKYYSVASYQTDTNKIQYSLWGENYQRLKKYDSKILQDKKKDQVLLVDVGKSFILPQLFLNNTFVNEINSKALIDNEGKPVYFKQKGNMRVLYRGKDPIFEYQGYYGKLVDIDKEGNIYFIASTRFGSSLFTLTIKNELFRRMQSDLIVDAKHLYGNKFFVIELSKDGYEYKVINGNYSFQAPAYYAYFFERKSEFNIFDEVSSKQSASNKEFELSSYNSITNMKFSKWGFSYHDFLGKGADISLTSTFVDPLQYSELSLEINMNLENQLNEYGFTYYYTKYLLDIGFGLNMAQLTAEDSATGETITASAQQVDLVAQYPFIQKGDWKMNGRFELSQIQAEENPFSEYYMGLSYIKYKAKGLSLLPYKKISFESEFAMKGEGMIFNLNSEYSKDLGDENIMSLVGGFTYLSNTTIGLAEPLSNWGGAKESEVSYQGLSVTSLEASYGFRLGGSFQKVVELQMYWNLIPVGIRRLAPALSTNYVMSFGDQSMSYYTLTGGLNLELLLMHRIPMLVSFEVGHINSASTEEEYNYAQFSLNKSF